MLWAKYIDMHIFNLPIYIFTLYACLVTFNEIKSLGRFKIFKIFWIFDTSNLWTYKLKHIPIHTFKQVYDFQNILNIWYLKLINLQIKTYPNSYFQTGLKMRFLLKMRTFKLSKDLTFILWHVLKSHRMAQSIFPIS